MHRLRGFFTRITAYRIALLTGFVFALLHLWEVARRDEVPLVGKLENALKDLKFRQRGQRQHSGRVVVAAVDEASVAKFGRWPWDWRVVASLVDKLTQEGAAVVAFDMSFSDQDLGGRFSGAKRFRSRFEDVSLAVGKGRAAVDEVLRVDTDIAGAGSALSGLAGKVTPPGEPFFQTARDRLDDGKGRIAEAKAQLQTLVKAHEAYAAELDHDVEGLDPDEALAAALQRNGHSIVGFVALLQDELKSFTREEVQENVERIARGQIRRAYYEEPLDPANPSVFKDTPVEQTWLKQYLGLRAPLAPIAARAAAFGFFNALPDQDGVIRSAGLALTVRGHNFGSLDTMAVALALGLKADDVKPVVADLEKGGGNLSGVRFGDKLFVPTDARGLIRVNYYGGDGTFTNLSIADIVDGRTPPGAVQGKVVLVGATAQGTFDQRVTPFSKISAGIETHCNAIENMLAGTFLQRTWAVEGLEVLFLALLAICFGFLFARVRVGLGLPVLAVGSVTIYLLSYSLFRAGYDVIAALPLLEFATMYVLVTVFRYATEERDKRQLRKAFQLYLNPDVMEEMLKAPEKLQLGGEERELTVLFSDIRGFTTLSEKLTPAALVKLMNEYLSPMTDIVFEQQGTLDKYIGDAVMAFFGAPVANEHHASSGCEAALRMMEKLARLREKWRIEDPSVPHLDIGIGLNSGPMVVGNMGSAQRFNYTVMGDNVNSASRLEGLNKEYGTHILITEATLAMAQRGGGQSFAARELDSVRVKGKKEPVRLFELRGRGAVPPADKPLLESYERGLALYREQRFATARLSFEECLTIAPSDGPSRLLLQRCDAMNARPPGEGWDGVYEMLHK